MSFHPQISSRGYFGPVSSSIDSINRSHSHSINLVTADLVTGWEHDGHLSPVRRFFCLLVTFDLLFTSLMWLICVMVTGENIGHAITEQVLHYTLEKSLFDIVMVAIVRFVVLLLFYALLVINHWCVIALSTSGTCVFLIVKVFMYNWLSSTQPVFQVLLILISFILAWGEAWFMDFRVIPQETNARNFFIAATEGERTPLLTGGNDYDRDNIGMFYSPQESPEDTDEEEERLPGIFRDEEYIKMGMECVQKSWQLLNCSAWKLEKEGVYGDTIRTMQHEQYGKIFKLTGVVNCPAKKLLDELFNEIENVPVWNPTLLESRRIQIINQNTDITYQATTGGGGGMVSSRDFVNLRRWDVCEGSYVSAAMSVEHPSTPVNKKYVRGENSIGCWAMTPGLNPDTCTFQWLLSLNLKGWLPQYVLDAAYTTVMTDYMVYLRKHCISLQEQEAISIKHA